MPELKIFLVVAKTPKHCRKATEKHFARKSKESRRDAFRTPSKEFIHELKGRPAAAGRERINLWVESIVERLSIA